MIASRRRQFNRDWTPERYQRFLEIIQEITGEPMQFRHSETPSFLPSSLISEMAAYGVEMLDSLLASDTYMQASLDAIPAQYRVPNESSEPLFMQADFGLDENLEPKLVEIQGFPSLYAYQPSLAAAYRDAYQIDPALHALPGGISDDEYWTLLRKAIVGDHDPENVILMEIDPAKQKTRCDFLITEQKLGVKAVDIRALRKRGNKLYHGDVPVERIYNRTIIDELERRNIDIPFRWTDELDVEWAGHPNWFFKLSKFSLPWLDHKAVPRTLFVDDAEIDDPSRWVLKPLWSFAGTGVVVGPTREQIESVRGQGYILQQRVEFRPVIETPHGPTRAEIRIMYIGRRAVNTIVRMGRGQQMGVDHNKGLEWVGASAGFIEP